MSNIKTLHLDISEVESTTTLRDGVLRNLPASLRHLFLTSPSETLNNDSPVPHNHTAEVFPKNDLPSLQVLAVEEIEDFDSLEALLPIFRGLKLRTLVVSPHANLTMENNSANQVRRILKVINEAFPSLSDLAFSAFSMWADEEKWDETARVSLDDVLVVFAS